MADAVDPRVPGSGPIDLGDETTTIRVGEELFCIHHKLISAHISQRLRQNAKQCGQIKHSWHNSGTFHVFVQYLYTGKISWKEATGNHPDYDGYYQLVDLYLLSKDLRDTKAMDAAIDAILAVYHNTGREPRSTLTRTSIEHVYKWNKPGCKLRRLLVDIASWEGNEDLLEDPKSPSCPNADDEHKDIWLRGAPPEEFTKDLAKKSLARVKAEKTGRIHHGSYATTSVCQYHEHKAEHECLSKKRKREDAEDEAAGLEPRNAESKVRKLEAELEKVKGEVERLRGLVSDGGGT